MGDAYAESVIQNEETMGERLADLKCLGCGGAISKPGNRDTEVNANAVTVFGSCAICGKEYGLMLIDGEEI